MPHNNVTQEALPSAVGMAYLTFLTNLPPDIVLGSFAGSVIFLLGVNNKPKWQWLVYFMLAFMAGVLGALPISSIGEGILGLIGVKAEFSQGLGAMFSAACTINFISWFRDNPSVLIQWKKGGKTS